MAIRNGEFLVRRPRRSPDRLTRTWRLGQPGPDAFLEDYASTALGLLALYQTDPDPKWFSAAARLADQMIDLFLDPAGGFFDTAQDARPLLVRPKDLQDNATPSGSSLAAQLLLQLSAYTGDGRYRDLAEAALSPVASLALQVPTAFSNWLCAADLAIGPLLEVAVVGHPNQHLLAALWSAYRPRLVAASAAVPNTTPPLLAGRTPLNGQAAAFICEGFVCQQPLTDPQALLDQLSKG